MMKRVSYLFNPVYNIRADEKTTCDEYRLEKFGSGAPSVAVLRTLIYQTIGYRNSTPFWDGSRISEHDIIVSAHLNPTVWGITRSLEQQQVLHVNLICLGCLSFWDSLAGGDLLIPMCQHCYKEFRADLTDVPFWHTVGSWPVECQLALYRFIKFNRKRILKDG